MHMLRNGLKEKTRLSKVKFYFYCNTSMESNSHLENKREIPSEVNFFASRIQTFFKNLKVITSHLLINALRVLDKFSGVFIRQ